MEMLDYFRRLFNYNQWANGETLTGLRAIENAPARSRKFIAHIAAAEWLWLRRLKTGKQMSVWPELTLEECESEFRELEPAWCDYLAGLGKQDLGQELSYTNTMGERWKSVVADVLTHAAMHSAYHRGQIASDMRQAGNSPAYTDFIHCVRKGFLGK